jgi:hypothetical protein
VSLILLLAVMSVRAEIVALLLLRRVLDHYGGGMVADDVAEHLDCPCMAMMMALLFWRLSCVAVYAAPKLEMASVSDVVDASSSGAFMLYPSWMAGVAVNAAMWTASPQNMERCEIHGVGHDVTSLYPCFIFLSEEASGDG